MPGPDPEPIIPDDVPGDPDDKKSHKKVEWVLVLSFVFMAIAIIAFYSCRFVAKRRKNKISFKHAYTNVMVEDGHSGGSNAFRNLVKNPDLVNQRYRSVDLN